MLKILFFDNWGLEIVDNLKRTLGKPTKHPANPLFLADQPWENGNMSLYGSVIKLPGRPFQLWYSVVHKPWNVILCYAESDDGLHWKKPLLDMVRYRGRKTNIILDTDIHGAAIIYDPVGKTYRMMTGSGPTRCIHVFNSPDGIHWNHLNQGPVISNNPDCAIGLLRTRKGQFAAYHRHPSTGRRVCRTTSWDFRFWDSEPKLVFEPDAHDPPQLQFYALGSMQYGSYEVGTVWTYHTYMDDLATWHMRGRQQAELAYSRNGYCWHRAAQGQPFIPHGSGKAWDSCNLQCASQPVLLDDEIRYYFKGADIEHSTDWELEKHTSGLGMATLKPDRFVALEAGGKRGELLTAAFGLCGPQLFINADIAPRGEVRAELLDHHGKPIKGFGIADCLPIRGDSLSHAVSWAKHRDAGELVKKAVRARLHLTRAKLYSIFAPEPGETPVYNQFYAPF